MSFNQISFGEPKRNESPSVNPRPAIESGNPPTLDPLGWLAFGKDSSGDIPITYETGLAGDMILIFAHEIGTPAGNIVTPSGFTQVFYELNGTSDEQGSAFYAKIAEGDESGALLLATTGSVGVFVGTNRIKANGAPLSIAGIDYAVAKGGFGTENPPALGLTGADNFLAITGLNLQSLGISGLVYAPPTGYEYGVDRRDDTSDPSLQIAQRVISGAGTEDPTDWVSAGSGSGRSTVYTIGIPIDPSPSPFDHTHVESEVTDHTTLTQKVTPVVADVIKGYDSADSFNPVWFELGNLPSSGGGGSGAWTFLDSVELGSDTASVTFSTIAGTYRTLIIHCYARSDRAAGADGMAIQVGNGSVDTGTNYDWGFQRENSGSTSAISAEATSDTRVDSGGNNVTIIGDNVNAANFNEIVIRFPGYADTSIYRPINLLSDALVVGVTGWHTWINGIWKNTASVIDTIKLFPELGSNFKAGSKFYLYGIDDA